MPTGISNRPTLIDTGPIVAALNKRDAYHQACVDAFKSVGPFVYTCWPVITEAAYLLGRYSPATNALFHSLRTRAYRILPLNVDDVEGIERILSKYADQDFQLADAALMYLADREGFDQVLTIDHTDFRVFRTKDGRPLTLLPNPD